MVKATDVEGIFRLSGSAKRIKDLQNIFNSPDRYGKGLDWTGYTVHDAANILRRYLNQLPEPIVPLQYYEQFRDPLRAYQAKMGGTAQAQAMENQEHARAVVAYQKLITELPALNRQLLLYILDLLAVFASKSDLNRMTAQNLAAIFQPGIISHPSHDMAPNEYRLSQDVLIFLIENQDNFLIGMTGTAMDQKTKDEVKSGPPSIKTPKTATAIGRSASTASAGAESVRRTTGIRRNGSMSSRHSRDRGSPGVSSPVIPASPSALTSPTSATGSAGGGLGRSNTVPSNRSPPLAGPRFQRMTEASPSETPAVNPLASGGGPGSGPEEVEEEDEPIKFPVVTGGGAGQSDSPIQPEGVSGDPSSPVHGNFVRSVATDPIVPGTATEPKPPYSNQGSENTPHVNTSVPTATQDPVSTTPVGTKPNTRDRKISNLLSISPIFGPSDQSNQRQTRKLQKRRIPGSHNESAQSSQASLNAEEGTFSHTPGTGPHLLGQDRADNQGQSASNVANIVATEHGQNNLNVASPTMQDTRGQGRGLMPPQSPTTSIHSRGSATDPSDFDAMDDPVTKEERKRRKFRLSSARNDPSLPPPPSIGQLPGARTSNSSLGSNRPRKSFTGDSQLTQTSAADTFTTGQQSFMNVSSRESAEMLKDSQAEPEKKGLFGRFKAKISQSRDQHDADRAKSPPRVQGEHASSRGSLSAFTHDHFAVRGRSFDRPRENSASNIQERDSVPNSDGQPVQRQLPFQTTIQPPTPIPGPISAPDAPRVATQAPLSASPPQMQQPPPHSQTFPVGKSSITPVAAAPPAPAPVVPGRTSQDVASNIAIEAGETSSSQQPHRSPQPQDTIANEKDTSQSAAAPGPIVGTGNVAAPSEQAVQSVKPIDPIATSDFAARTDDAIAPSSQTGADT